VRDGHSAVFLQQQLCNWLPDNVGAANNHSSFAGEVIAQCLLRQQHAACWCTWHQCAIRVAAAQKTNVDRVEPVDVFLWFDQIKNFVLVDVLWQRQLHENAVNSFVFIQTRHKSE